MHTRPCWIVVFVFWVCANAVPSVAAHIADMAMSNGWSLFRVIKVTLWVNGLHSWVASVHPIDALRHGANLSPALDR